MNIKKKHLRTSNLKIETAIISVLFFLNERQKSAIVCKLILTR